MGRENHLGAGIRRRSREHIAARAFDGNLVSLKASPDEFVTEEISDRAFVAGD